MENNALLSLVSLMLPSNILSRFTLVKIESTDDTISIHMDEKIPYDDIKSENTRYSREFAAFLKEVYGNDAFDLPFA